MIAYLTLILTCQLIGEAIVSALDIAVPGPVLGMVFLFIFLMVRGKVPDDLETTGQGLLRSMSLLFVPAGTGVIMHIQLLSQALVPLGLAVAVSTSTTIVVTGLMMRWLGKEAADG